MHHALTTASDRLEIVVLPESAAKTTFAQDVAEGLSRAEKALPSKYLYDDLGSALFDAITHLPEYYLTGAETQILQEWGWEIVRMMDGPFEFLELGSGSAVKTRLLIDEALRVQRSLRYSPIDISAEALRTSAASLVDTYPNLRVRAYAGDYFDVLRSPVLKLERRTLAMLMGSNIGNYRPEDARALVSLLAKALKPGDGLLLGADRKKDRATLELAYDDPAGVTAAFDKNILGRINRELGATFDLRTFAHIAIYDEERGAVDSYVESSREQDVYISKLDMSVHFTPGERIHTESSYKFDDADVAKLAAATGFDVKHAWQDARKRFAISLLIRKG